LGDGDEKDRPEHLCVDVVTKEARPAGVVKKRKPDSYFLPRCMDMITADEVIRRIELYFTGGAIRYLTPSQARIAKAVVAPQLTVRA
jgi:hypothetical protein